MAERREWTREDLTALQQAAETLERLAVWGVTPRGPWARRTEVYVGTRDFIRIARLGVAIEKPRYQHPRWDVRADVGGAVVCALMETDELPSIGWRLAGPNGMERVGYRAGEEDEHGAG